MYQIGQAYGSFKSLRLAIRRIKIRRYKIDRAYGSTNAMIGSSIEKSHSIHVVIGGLIATSVEDIERQKKIWQMTDSRWQITWLFTTG
jgi:hypothetical protein